MSDPNAKLARKAQSILKDLGHEVSLGHSYELLARLYGFKSHNVAAAKLTTTGGPTCPCGKKKVDEDFPEIGLCARCLEHKTTCIWPGRCDDCIRIEGYKKPVETDDGFVTLNYNAMPSTAYVEIVWKGSVAKFTNEEVILCIKEADYNITYQGLDAVRERFQKEKLAFDRLTRIIAEKGASYLSDEERRFLRECILACNVWDHLLNKNPIRALDISKTEAP